MFKKIFKNTSLLIGILVIGTSFSSFAVDLLDEYDLYLRTFSEGSGLDVRIRQVSLNRLGEQGFELPLLAQEAIKSSKVQIHFVLYMPEGLSLEEQKEYQTIIKNKIKQSYPQASLDFKAVVLDSQKSLIEMEKDNQEIRQELIDHPLSGNAEKRVGRLFIALNHLKYALNFITRASDVKEALKGLKSFSSYDRDISIATAFGVGKAAINAMAWLGTSESKSSAAIMAAVTGWGLDVWFARNAQKWVTWKKSSILTWNRFGFGALAKFINKTETRRVFLIDQLNGLFWNIYFRTLAYLDKPNATNPVFSMGGIQDFWLPISISLVTDAPIGSWSQVAINNLRQKGILNSRIQFYLFLMFDLSYSAKSFMMQRGYSFLYWPMYFSELIVRLGFIAHNAMSSAKETKIVLLDPSLKPEAVRNILHQEGIVLPENPLLGYLDTEEVLKDWNLRRKTYNQLHENKMEQALKFFEQEVYKIYSLIVLTHAQRATGVDVLDLTSRVNQGVGYLKNTYQDFKKACESIYRIK